MATVGILYYSSNREDPIFENNVRKTILDNCGDLPILSVTHKPMNFGRNITVGDVGVSGYNMFRQVLIGCKEFDVDFILSAESDCLYPPSYFKFIPDRKDRCYRNTNLYVMPDRRDFFFHKTEGATHSQIVSREFYIERLEKLFGDGPEWSTEEFNFPKERHKKDDIFSGKEIIYYKTSEPVIQIKTHKGMRYYTHSERVPIRELPYWGHGKPLKRKYLYDIIGSS